MGTRPLILAAAVAATLIAAAPAAAKPPKSFVGVVAEDVYAGDAAYRDAQLARQASLGVGLIRQTFDWAEIEKTPGHYDFSVHDGYMAATARHGIEVLPILFRPPPFHSSAPPVPRRGTYPPRHPASMGAFGAAIARRYGPNGSFWAQNPGLPKVPIRAYQIWNEPNLPPYWPSGPSAKQYAGLLRGAAAGIKRADPRAEIVTAGIPDSRLSRPGYLKYIQALYKAKGKLGFDTLALNPYARSRKELEKKLRDVRAIMNHNRDHRAAIRATELGWSDIGPRSPFRVGASGQSARISTSLPLLSKLRRKLRLKGFVYYSWKDAPPYPPLYQDFWGLHTGLLTIDGRPKPALEAFRRSVAKLR
jgi:hypothetical protein